MSKMSIKSRSLYFSVLTLVLASCFSISALAQSNCDSIYQLTVHFMPMKQDGSPDSTNMIPPEKSTPLFYFETWNQECRFRSEASDIRLNNRRLPLQSWCFEQTLNYSTDTTINVQQPLTNAKLSEMSRSYPFTVNSGDTIEVLRRIWWHKYYASAIEYDSSYTPDSLFWVIDIKKVSNNQRVVLLDSVMVPQNNSYGRNIYFSLNPIPTSLLSHIFTSDYNNEELYVDFTVAARGDSNYRFMRHDTHALNYKERFIAPLTKRVAEKDDPTQPQLFVNKGDNDRSIAVRLQLPKPEQGSVYVFDIQGKKVAEQQYSNQQSTFNFANLSPGAYVIVARSGSTNLSHKYIVRN